VSNTNLIKFPLTVFLDTNVFIKSCFNFSSGQLNNLKKYCEAGLIKILTNDIVIREVSNNIKMEVPLASSHIRNSIKNEKYISELRNSELHSYVFKDFRDEGWDEYILHQWDNFRDELDFEKINLSSVDFISIINDYFERKPPFEETKKEEFPDAIIIDSIKKYSEKTYSNIIVVSGDKGWENVFNDNPKIELVNEISELLNKISTNNSPELVEMIIDKYAEIRSDITKLINDNIYDFNITYIPYTEDHMIIQKEINAYDVDNINIDLAEHSIYSFDYVSKDSSEISVVAKIAFTLSYSEIDYDNSYFDKVENKYLFKAEHYYKERHETSVDITVKFKYDEELKLLELEDIDMDEIYIAYDTCTEEYSTNNFDNICPDCGGPIHLYNDGGDGFCAKCSPKH